MANRAVIEKVDSIAVPSSSRIWYGGLDGVRAIAVLLVFFVHYLPQLTLHGGWVGVLIFFVLSGFLITGILFDSQQDPHRFKNFYIRRTLRIFPLFYFSWIGVLLAGWALHAVWKPGHLFWLVYLGNYVRFFAGSDVLDRIYTSNPLLRLEIGHFWSLAVEEQFYLVWPFIVFFVGDRKKLIRICAAAVMLVPVIRLACNLLLPQGLLSMELLYRLTLTQCDGFLLGGLLALWLRGPGKDKLLAHSNKILLSSLAALLIAYLVNGKGHLLPLTPISFWMSTYGFTLVDLAAAGLLLCALRPLTAVYRFLTLSTLQVIGRYSYGIYVYHVILAPFLFLYVWPINPAHKDAFYRAHIVGDVILYLAIVVAVSACSYHLIERPFLKMKDSFTFR